MIMYYQIDNIHCVIQHALFAVIGILASLLLYDRKLLPANKSRGSSFYIGIGSAVVGFLADLVFITTIALSCIYTNK